MTICETYCTVSGMKLWATAGLMLMLVLSSSPALAAQIDITNCTDTRVGICSFDEGGCKGCTPNQKNTLAKLADGPDTEHFTCHANCYFMMSTASELGGSCTNSNHYHEIDHSYGAGEYLLVGVEQNDKNN